MFVRYHPIARCVIYAETIWFFLAFGKYDKICLSQEVDSHKARAACFGLGHGNLLSLLLVSGLHFHSSQSIDSTQLTCIE